MKLPKGFIKDNPVEPTSAAFITWLLRESLDAKEYRDKLLAENDYNDQKKADREAIQQLETAEDFFKWMRKPLPGKNQLVLHRAMLDRESIVGEMIRKRIMTNHMDDFIERSIQFLIDCKEDPSPWIRENIDQIADPYARSMLCFVLGYRGGKEDTDLLLEQARRFAQDDSEETNEQGPIIALYLIHGHERYLRQAYGV